MSLRPVTFVWMPSHKGPVGEIWYGIHKQASDKTKPRPLFRVNLPEHQCELPLGDLEKLYPLEAA